MNLFLKERTVALVVLFMACALMLAFVLHVVYYDHTHPHVSDSAMEGVVIMHGEDKKLFYVLMAAITLFVLFARISGTSFRRKRRSRVFERQLHRVTILSFALLQAFRTGSVRSLIYG